MEISKVVETHTNRKEDHVPELDSTAIRIEAETD
eukprot:CAMPEP_0168743726 /NCGR_PEP_ID=MMETSP0724-20121128/13726_1 /TAXON_ID=265536 /ORGANISM="Amphiprora sp., Strain CCMP467" /LENGTH=33 /DNA_ID= /DNA_START= /DNA_END= /DNA_ORIENTATION=